ncbi:MAG TPA: hypothetical protein VFO55_10360 [Gemmatimonadaceae bacterium]|nr:hypothetical protein [Gemmatimonadaceae bacterium]
MRRLMVVALIGLAVAGSAAEVSAQGRGGRSGASGRGAGRAGVMDTARMRRMDSIRVARGDTARRRGPDSLRQHRMDSLRAAGVLDGARRGRGPDGRGRMGGPGEIAGMRGALAGIQLNENEQAAIKTITAKYREEMKEHRDANQGTARGQNAELRTQMMAIAERERAEIRAALTAEHQAQFDANVAKGPGRGNAGPPAGRRPPRPPVR